jgi:FkbM family methyltransferase
VTYEPYNPLQALDIIRVLDFEPKWLLDCGPGFGQEALRFKEKWPSISIVGFEPNRETHVLVEPTYPGFLFRLAVSDKDGAGILYNTDRAQGASLRKPDDYRPDGTAAPTEFVTLDTAMALYAPSPVTDAVIWADVEGSEAAVVRGAAKLVESGAVRAINVEVYAGENEAWMNEFMATRNFGPRLRYAGNGLHLDVVYLLGYTGKVEDRT